MAAHQNTWMVGVGMVVIFGLLNAIGVEIFGKVEVVLTFGMWTHADHFRPVRHFYGAGHPSVRLVRHTAER
ncbi:putative amino acid/amine transport protein [Klebsiella pneumoniae]|uniref:Putative amino acid/amine transport protein n=1 Tax=Klebsiella pneumoniae TaxID=573 RepID=A0A378F958_KLEPN|nr:putative amino acid/amine transport protein [Klebsiella pneumoniae]